MIVLRVALGAVELALLGLATAAAVRAARWYGRRHDLRPEDLGDRVGALNRRLLVLAVAALAVGAAAWYAARWGEVAVLMFLTLAACYGANWWSARALGAARRGGPGDVGPRGPDNGRAGP